jgi:hypothetical protein
MEFAKYRQVPTNLQEEIVKRRKAEKEERMALAR